MMDLRKIGSHAWIAAAAALQLMIAAPVWSQPTTGARNMLWRVTSDSTVVYLLGSVHLLPKSAYPLNPAIERAFDSSERVLFELNLDSVSAGQTTMVNAMITRGMYNDGRTLRSTVSAATYKQLVKKVRKLGMEMMLFERMRPWMAAFMLMAMDAQGGGFQAEYGIDMYFHRRATEASKPVAGLERLEDQIGIFSELSDAGQEAFLKQMLDNRRGTNEMDLILKSWKRGDTRPLEAMLARYASADAQLYEAMVFKRNRNWMPQIESILSRRQRALVVVGTLHLVGDQGVVALLRKRGYTVEQL